VHTNQISDITAHFQDGGHDVISRKSLSCGVCDSAGTPVNTN